MTTQTSSPKLYVESVRGQYEILPYPMRDYRREREVLHTSDNASLDSINHEGWGGRRDLRAKGTRFLIAGQGTGDTTVFLAEQLRGSDAEIVSIDLSTASIGICKKRLAERGLTNVTVHHMSILDLPTAGLGQFDFIESSGVLHHLADPEEGLRALASVLKDDGLMSIMVYALYGRLPVYMMQALMQYLMTPETHPQVKLEVARAFFAELPKTHAMKHAYGWFALDIEDESGSGIYDLVLHSTDRAYTVPQLYEWMASAGLSIGNFCGEWEGNAAYTPETYTDSPLLKALVRDRATMDRQAIAELMSGSLIKHIFYASKQPKMPAQFADDMVVSLGFRQRAFTQFTRELVAELVPLAQGAVLEKPATMLLAPPLRISKRAHTLALLPLLESERTIDAIVSQVAADALASAEEVRADFAQLYGELNYYRRAFLRHASVAPYPQWREIFTRLPNYPSLNAGGEA